MLLPRLTRMQQQLADSTVRGTRPRTTIDAYGRNAAAAEYAASPTAGDDDGGSTPTEPRGATLRRRIIPPESAPQVQAPSPVADRTIPAANRASTSDGE